MPTEGTFTATRIAASGLSAERQRMEIAAQNIANAHSTRSVDGGPYRRRQVLFGEMVHKDVTGADDTARLGGVKVLGIEQDPTPFPTMFDPGHPDADANGMVQLPNVEIPHELVDLMTASRAYEANLKSLDLFRQMTEQTLGLLRGVG
jgi:flagellar basal-body rod protein FlgC